MRLGDLPDWLQNKVVAPLLAAKILSAPPNQAIVNEYLPGQGMRFYLSPSPHHLSLHERYHPAYWQRTRIRGGSVVGLPGIPLRDGVPFEGIKGWENVAATWSWLGNLVDRGRAIQVHSLHTQPKDRQVARTDHQERAASVRYTPARKGWEGVSYWSLLNK